MPGNQGAKRHVEIDVFIPVSVPNPAPVSSFEIKRVWVEEAIVAMNSPWCPGSSSFEQFSGFCGFAPKLANFIQNRVDSDCLHLFSPLRSRFSHDLRGVCIEMIL